MSQALVRSQPQALALNDFEGFQKYGELFAQSRMFSDVQSAAQAAVKIMAGSELGLTPFQSMSSLHVVKGKITPSADLLARKVKESGKYNYRVLKHSATECVIEFLENGQPVGQSSLTMAEAKAANMDKEWDKESKSFKDKLTWKNFPKNMLFARAISNGVRWFCPDVVTATMYVADELSDADTAITTEAVPVVTATTEAEDIPEVIAAIKGAAKSCGLGTPKAITGELQSIGITLPNLKTLDAALEALTREQRATALNHLQNKSIAVLSSEVAPRAEVEEIQGEVVI